MREAAKNTQGSGKRKEMDLSFADGAFDKCLRSNLALKN